MSSAAVARIPSTSAPLGDSTTSIASTAGSVLRVPPELHLPSQRVTATRQARHHQQDSVGVLVASEAATMEMPGTPPLEDLQNLTLAAESTTPSSAQPLQLDRAVSCAEDRPHRMRAAGIIQRCARGYVARQARARLASAIGRPAEVSVSTITNLEMLCDFRDVVAMYCNVRILKKPYGPFMFQFTTSRCSHVNLPTWQDEFFVPMMSSKCEVVVTLIGVNTAGKKRFLGQAVAPLDTGWEKRKTEVAVPLSKWKFPVDETLLGLHRFVTGNVHCIVTPLTARYSCISGQFLMAPAVSPSRSSSFFDWTKRTVAAVASPQQITLPETPTASRKEMVTRWGVLTDTHLHLFDHSSANLLVSIELSKLQLVRSLPPTKGVREPGRLYSLKIYCSGTLYALYVSTYAQQVSWEYKIDLHRRRLLVP